MNRIRSLALRSLYILSLLILTTAPVRAEEAPANLGQHTVVKGDTLYCLGRGYRVDPAAIAKANKLSRTARLIVGQVLTIPAVMWAKAPAGPVCATQFQSPYEGAGVPQATAVTDANSSATATSVPATSIKYTVQRGDTLYRIAVRFHVAVAEIQKASGLTGTTIYVGQMLVIPFSGIVEPPPCLIKGNVSINTGEKIYHVPGGEFYDETIIRPEFGERWFCTEEEAVAAGWRKSER